MWEVVAAAEDEEDAERRIVQAICFGKAKEAGIARPDEDEWWECLKARGAGDG